MGWGMGAVLGASESTTTTSTPFPANLTSLFGLVVPRAPLVEGKFTDSLTTIPSTISGAEAIRPMGLTTSRYGTIGIQRAAITVSVATVGQPTILLMEAKRASSSRTTSLSRRQARPGTCAITSQRNLGRDTFRGTTPSATITRTQTPISLTPMVSASSRATVQDRAEERFTRTQFKARVTTAPSLCAAEAGSSTTM